MKCAKNDFFSKRKPTVMRFAAWGVCFFVAVAALFLGIRAVKRKNVTQFFAGEYYFLTFYRGKNALAAKEAASRLLLRGGAGYLDRGEEYAVFGCVYAEEKTAKRVAAAIQETGTEVWVEKGSANLSVPRASVVLLALEGLKEGGNDVLSSAEKVYRAIDDGKEASLVKAAAEAAAERALASAKEVTARLAAPSFGKQTGKVVAKSERKAREAAERGAELLTEAATRFRSLASETPGAAFGTESAIAVRYFQISFTLSYLALFS